MSMQPSTNRIPEWTVADRLRKARESAGLSQADLAELTGISRRTISSYEQGSTPKRTNVLAWAMATGYPYTWITDGSTGGTNPPGDQQERTTGRSSVLAGRRTAQVVPLRSVAA